MGQSAIFWVEVQIQACFAVPKIGEFGASLKFKVFQRDSQLACVCQNTTLFLFTERPSNTPTTPNLALQDPGTNKANFGTCSLWCCHHSKNLQLPFQKHILQVEGRLPAWGQTKSKGQRLPMFITTRRKAVKIRWETTNSYTCTKEMG